MSQNTKRRLLKTGELREHKCTDSLQAKLSILYQKAGIPLGSGHADRRTSATRILENIGDMDVVRSLLGQGDLSCTDRYLGISQGTLRAMFESAILRCLKVALDSCDALH